MVENYSLYIPCTGVFNVYVYFVEISQLVELHDHHSWKIVSILVISPLLHILYTYIYARDT